MIFEKDSKNHMNEKFDIRDWEQSFFQDSDLFTLNFDFSKDFLLNRFLKRPARVRIKLPGSRNLKF